MQESLLKADIFFFVTTIAVAAIAVLLIVGLLYILNIIRTLRRIVHTVEKGAGTVMEGIESAKQNIKEEGVVGSLLEIFKQVARKKVARKTHKRI